MSGAYNDSYFLEDNKKIKKEFLGATKKFADIIGGTMGSMGKPVLFHTNLNRVRVTNDGIQIIRTLQPADAIEQAALAFSREVSDKTNFENGDFSSGSAWLYAQFVLGNVKFKKSDDDLIEDVISRIKAKSIPVETVEDLINIATISCKDETLGKLIGEMSWELNKHSTTVIKYAAENKDHHEIVEGLSTFGGFASHTFYKERRETIKDPKIIIIDDEITSFKQIKPLYAQIQENDEGHEGQYIIIARGFSQEVTETVLKARENYALDIRLLLLNSSSGMLKDTMKNLAIISDATLMGEGTAYPITRSQAESPLLNPRVMGTVKDFVIDMAKGDVIFTPKDSLADNKKVKDRVKDLQDLIKKPETSPTDVDRYRRLISQINGKVAYLYISGDTPAEQEYIALTAEDAVNACKSARETGYIPGGGVCLRDIALEIMAENRKNKPIGKVLMSLYNKILLNAKIKHRGNYEPSIGYNVSSGEKGNMVDLKVIDPAKGVIFGLKTSYSLAKKVNNSSTLVVNKNPE